MDTWRDRVAVITGAGRGIGREHALLFAAEGAIENEGRWTVEELQREAARLADVKFELGNPFGGG